MSTARLALLLMTALLTGILFVLIIIPGVPSPRSSQDRASANSSRNVFERRILPIFNSKNPSACSECHLSGVDLKNYIRPSEAETFAALRQQGMVDSKQPENSRILHFIRMSLPKTSLVTQNVRNAEYAAFHDWIVAAVKNPKLAGVSISPPARRIGPVVSVDVIRHTRLDSVVASFERNIWSQEGRCMGCHRPDNQENVKKYGERVRWFVPDSPDATMQRLIAQGDVNVEKPEESLLLLKPLNKVAHGGGVKMLYGDAGYKMFRAWLEDYSASVKGKYRTTNDLPTPPQNALIDMNSILAVSNGPQAWAGKLLRTDVYSRDAGRNTWGPKPVATGERLVYAENNGQPNGTNLIMFLLVPAHDAKTQAELLRARLRPGRYLLKYYSDITGKLNQDYTLPTDSPGFYQGQQEITATWGGGWGNPVKVQINLVAPMSGAESGKP